MSTELKREYFEGKLCRTEIGWSDEAAAVHHQPQCSAVQGVPPTSANVLSLSFQSLSSAPAPAVCVPAVIELCLFSVALYPLCSSGDL